MRTMLQTILEVRERVRGYKWSYEMATLYDKLARSLATLNDEQLKVVIRDNLKGIRKLSVPSHRKLVDKLETLTKTI